MSKIISIDFETYFDDECSVRTLGNWAYTHHPKFDAYLVALYDGQESWVGHPRDLDWSALEGATLVAHNAAFDKSVCDALADAGKAPRLSNPWICTANLSSYLGAGRSLAEAMWNLEGVRRDKSIRDAMEGKVFETDLTEEEKLEFLRYADTDARNCWDLFAKHGDKWPEVERKLSDLTIKQSLRGVAIDVPLLEKYHAHMQLVVWSVSKNLPWVQERDEKPTSTKAVAAECRKVGIPCPPLKKDGEELFDEWEKTYGPKFPFVSAYSRYRSLNKMAEFLTTIRDRLRPDNTIDFSLLYCQAGPGRWSGGGGGLNMQNLRKEPLYFNGTDEVEEKRQSTFEIDVRKLFVPRPNKKFIICDKSQIEPRCLAWVVEDRPFLESVSSGNSPYEAHARATMNWTGGELKKENADLYKLAKARVLGLGYGCGADKFVTVAWDMAQLRITPEQAVEAVQSFRAQNPLICDRETGIWSRLERDFQRSVNSDFEVELPSGRVLQYRKVLREVKLKKNRKTGEPTRKFVYTALVGGKRKEFYSGKLTENLIQAIARDVFGEDLLALEDGTGDVIFHVHDEAIVEVDLDVTVAEVEKVMGRTPAWLPGCPLASEGKESAHYLK